MIIDHDDNDSHDDIHEDRYDDDPAPTQRGHSEEMI